VNATEKNANIDLLKTRLASAQSLILADFRGLTVESDNKLRREFRAVGCEYQVVKNTLLGKAVKGTPMEVLDSLLAGPTAIAFSSRILRRRPRSRPRSPRPKASSSSRAVTSTANCSTRRASRRCLRCLARTKRAQHSLQPCLPCLRTSCVCSAQHPQNFVHLLAAREDALKSSEKK
jgi:hypothetical protein